MEPLNHSPLGHDQLRNDVHQEVNNNEGHQIVDEVLTGLSQKLPGAKGEGVEKGWVS